MRTRLRTTAAMFWGLAALTGVTVVLLVVPLAAAAAAPTAADELQVALVVAMGALAVAWGVVAIYLPRRRTAADADVARYVGARVPPIASDLLSAVELERELAHDPRFSAELTLAHAADTARRLHGLRPATLISTQPMRRAAAGVAAVFAVYALTLVFAPRTIAAGWSRLLSPPSSQPLVDDAIGVAEPLVGDLSVTLAYPAYTGRAPVTLPSSSGEVIAPRGTEVTLETTALRPASAAFIVFDGKPAREIPMLALGDERLRATFLLDAPGAYRFVLKPPTGRPLREVEPRKLDIEPDKPPRVDLFAPADDLEVSSRKRVELAYAVDDDYGVKDVTLVWRGGGREERKPIFIKKTGSGRSAQGKLMWDLTEVPLTPGERIAYHLEARDNDDVGGPNVGASRTYYLRVFSPRERHGELVDRQQALLEAAISLLADRLEAPAGELNRHHEILDGAERLVVELGQVAALVAKDPLSPKKLAPELDAMRVRLDKLAREEHTLLDDLDNRAARAPDHQLARGPLALLAASDQKNIVELEKDVIALDDWIARQRLEEMLAISDEIKQRRGKLDKLMAEYAKTGSEKLRAEIERELRAIEQLQRELEEKRARLSGEVADRFLNSDALQTAEERDCLAEVRELIAKGDAEGAKRQLARCEEQMKAAEGALEESLRGLRGDKFSEEEKAYAELMDEVTDLEHEERELAKQADEINRRYQERAAEVARDKGNPARDKAKKTLDRLRKQLAKVPRDGLTPFSQDEYDAVMRRLDDVERMIDEGDVAEALAMARQAREGLDSILADLDDDMSDGEPWSDKTDEAMQHAHRSQPLADQLVEDLDEATPKASEIMSPEDRARMKELMKRQQALRERTQRLAQKAQKKAKDLPENAGQAAQDGLDDAGEEMKGAEKRFGGNDPAGAKKQAESAADKLGGLKKTMQQSSRPTSVNGRGNDDDEVRIPGADEYKPPEEFREQILDAKRKGKAPEDYQDQVEQYYKEITK